MNQRSLGSLAFAILLSWVAPADAAAQRVLKMPKEDGQWTMPAKDFASTRFSGLTQITSGSAKRLRPVWSFSTVW